MDELDQELRDQGQEGFDFGLFEEMSMPTDPGAGPPNSTRWSWIVNEVCAMDTTIALRSTWQERIVDIQMGRRWTAVLLRQPDAGVLALMGAHWPTSWATDNEWLEMLEEEVEQTTLKWDIQYAVQDWILGADWNLNWDEPVSACARHSALRNS